MQGQVVMDADAIHRATVRMSHEILEANPGARDLCLIGIITRGDLWAAQIAAQIKQIEGVEVPVGSLDISFYRDDVGIHLSPEVFSTNVPFNIDGKTIVLVDDVLYTGRTISSALGALKDLGRPAKVQLAVLVDRGHRELPIRPDFVGKNVPSAADESVRFFIDSVDGHTDVEILQTAPGAHIGAAPLGNRNDKHGDQPDDTSSRTNDAKEVN
jgi:pyrimidine operon attenuation protein/uracil phosphoribosyltransferase